MDISENFRKSNFFICKRLMMMANNSFLVGSTKCSLLILVIGLSILPAAWCQYCNTVDGTFIRISIILG